ncbi:MAG: hypothetical protein IJM79_04350 [Erysipelotrichaceae bacterium]|nr:hypothetical protein [Erysipelotrichaceae bacterium]
MKKSSAHLTFGLLLMAVLIALTFIVGKNLPNEVNASTDLKDGYKLVYEVNSADSELIKKASEVLEKRLYNFGADSVTTTVDGSAVTLVYNGIEDNDNLRKNLTRTGDLSFRNSKDEKLDAEGVLSSDLPLACSQAENGSTVYFHVDSTDALKNLYNAMSASGDTMLVVWLDYQEGQTYEAESAKEDPAYLIAATMSSGIDGDFYVTTNKAFAETYDAVRVVDGGVLPAQITEKSFEPVTATYGSGALNRLFSLLACGLAVTGLYLILRHRLAGLVNTVNLFAFAVASLISVSWLDIPFGIETVALVLIALFAAVFVDIRVNERFEEQLRSGHNARTSYGTASGKLIKPVLFGLAFQLIAGLIAYLFFRELRNYGIIIMVLAVCAALFTVAGNLVLTNNLIASNYFEKNAWMSEKELLPLKSDVKFRYTAGLVGAVALIGIALALIGKTDILLIAKAFCCIAIAVVLAGVASSMSKKGYNALPIACGVVSAFAAGYLLKNDLLKAADVSGVALLTGSLAFVYAAVTLDELNDGYRELSRGKLSEERIEEMYGGILNGLNRITVICLIAVSVIALAVYLLAINAYHGIYMTVVGSAISSGCGIFVTAALWLKLFINRRNKPAGKKKAARKSNELKETTVFGINEIR